MYDSTLQRRSAPLEQQAFTWFKRLLKDLEVAQSGGQMPCLRGLDLDGNNWSLKVVQTSPQQPDSNSCGAVTLQVSRSVFLRGGLTFDFDSVNLSPEATIHMRRVITAELLSGKLFAD